MVCGPFCRRRDPPIIKQVDTWLGRRVESLSAAELCTLFKEIAEFRRTGILTGNRLRNLSREFSENVTHSAMDMRIVEDEILFEISRRYYNEKEEKKTC